MKVKLNKNAVFLELIRRVKENENGVRNYLSDAGIKVGDEGITVQQLNELRKIDYNAFSEMVMFLYPEIKTYVGADGDDNGKWTSQDTISTIGVVLGGASDILGRLNINGNTDAMAASNAYAALAAQQQAEQEKKQMRITILIVCLGFLVIVGAGVLIFKNRR